MIVNIAYVRDILGLDMCKELADDIVKIQKELPDDVVVDIDFSYGFAVSNVTNETTMYHQEYVGPKNIDITAADIIVLDEKLRDSDREEEVLLMAEKNHNNVIYLSDLKEAILETIFDNSTIQDEMKDGSKDDFDIKLLVAKALSFGPEIDVDEVTKKFKEAYSHLGNFGISIITIPYDEKDTYGTFRRVIEEINRCDIIILTETLTDSEGYLHDVDLTYLEILRSCGKPYMTFDDIDSLSANIKKIKSIINDYK